MKLDNNLSIAIKASLEAGKAIMDVYNSSYKIELKEDKSPLTEADKKANTIINEYLFPTGISIISEENREIPFEKRSSWSKCWIVDPVDGTKEFIKRNGEFTVNIALVKNGKPILGVIYVPVTKELYFADVNNGLSLKAQLSSHDSDLNEVVQVSKPLEKKRKNNRIRIVGSRSHMSQETLNYIASIEEKGKRTEIVSKGSSLKFCLVAEGKADIYPRFAPTMEWDTAAGQAICNALGIDVISQETKQPLLYNKENLLNPWFIVSK